MHSANDVEDIQLPTLHAVAFVRDVAKLYHRNALLFLGILLPAAIFAFLTFQFSNLQVLKVERHLPHGVEVLQHKTALLEIALYRWSGFFVSWVIYCFAFAAICVATRELELGRVVLARHCLAPVRERLGAFLRLSVMLWVGVIIASMLTLGTIVLTMVLWPEARRLGATQIGIGTALVTGCFLLILSRFGLSVPALILESINVRQSIFRSDQLTAACWTILAILLLESVGGSYLGIMLPRWLSGYAYAHGFHLGHFSWVVTAIGLIAAFLLEPHILVGFGLLYMRRTTKPVPQHLVMSPS